MDPTNSHQNYGKEIILMSTNISPIIQVTEELPDSSFSVPRPEFPIMIPPKMPNYFHIIINHGRFLCSTFSPFSRYRRPSVESVLEVVSRFSFSCRYLIDSCNQMLDYIQETKILFRGDTFPWKVCPTPE